MSTLNQAAIPQELKQRRQWVVWRFLPSPNEDTKPRKVLFTPSTGDIAASDDPATWESFEEAVAAFLRGGWEGIGYVFIAGDPFAGIDLDGCVDPETGALIPLAQAIAETFDSYTEKSPSGRGVHIIIRGVMPEGKGRKHGNYEAYSERRFFTITGNHVAGTPLTVEPRQPELDGFLTKYLPQRETASSERPHLALGNDISDDALLQKMFAAKNGAKVQALYQGGASGYASHSEADLALCSHLVWWTNGDANRVDPLFRRSSLMRNKWDERRGQHTYGERTIAYLLEDFAGGYTGGPSMTAALDAEDEWDTPSLLPDSMPPVDALDVDQLPEPFSDWLLDIHKRMQVPLDFPAVGALTVACSLIGRRIGIYPKRHDDWLVVPNQYAMIVGPPSVMKTPALAETMKPLDRLAAEAANTYQSDLGGYESNMMLAEARKKALSKEMDQAAKAKDETRMQELAEQVKDLRPTKPVARRYKSNDGTVEKLGELLLENPQGLLVFRDELTGWLRSLEKQGHEADRAFYLEAWNGTGSFDVDRISRGTLHIPGLCLSILGGIQPGPLASYVYAATSEDSAGNDGLLQRFGLVVWPDIPKTWENVDRWPDTIVKNRAYTVFKRLAALTPDKCGARTPEGEPDAIPALRFTSEAQDIFDQWREALEMRLRSGELEPVMTAHLAKYRSLMPSLALIFHLIEVVDQEAAELPHGVSERAALRATAWCEYLESHARRIYASAANPAMERAAALLSHIRKGEVTHGAPVRDIYRKQWAKLSTPDDVSDALGTLKAFGWLRIREERTGGRPTQRLSLHPDLRKNADTHQAAA